MVIVIVRKIFFLFLVSFYLLLAVVAAAPPPEIYDGFVSVRGNEPFTYVIFSTVYGEYELVGELVDEITARYQQRRIRIKGRALAELSTNELNKPRLHVEEVVGVIRRRAAQ